MRAALLEGDQVVNVIEYDPAADYDPAPYELVELADEPVGPGWRRRNGELIPPAMRRLNASPFQIPADGTTVSVVTYENSYDGAPTEVVFDVNGATATVPLVDGKAELEVVAATPDEIVVTCDELEVTITATEA